MSQVGVAADLALDSRADCDGDLILDECEIAACPMNDPSCHDCNANGLSDACDLANCVRDCNANGVPDECDACTVALCADADCDGIRDDNCLSVECGAQECSQSAVIFADVGGAFGDCAPDGFCNIHDANHVMACFANLSGCGGRNLDVGGPFGDCCPDGFCNVHDANHVMACFAGLNTCACPGACPAP